MSKKRALPKLKIKKEQFIAATLATIFIVVTLGSGVAVVWQIVEDGKGGDQQSTVNNTPSKGKNMQDFTPVQDVTELQSTDLKVGTGDEVKAGATVEVDYVGAVAATGAVFQSSKDFGKPISFGLSQVIPGWRDGMVGMKEGGVRRLLIPADQAYGATPPQGSGIPANAALVFDITLHSTK